MFYLGNFASMDTNESNFTNENPNVVLGFYDKPPIIEMTNYDQDDNGSIRDDEDNPAGDYMTYDLGSGTVTQFVDSTSYYNFTVTVGSGGTGSGEIMVIQMQNGDVFAVDLSGASIDGLNIRSIELTSLSTSSFGGHLTANSLENVQVVCFAAGTRIRTPKGEIRVEQLAPRMMVETLDHGPRPLIWTNRQSIGRAGRNAPISIDKAALGPGCPARPLRLSPQHRVMLRSKIIERMFGSAEVLAPARFLLGIPGVSQNLPILPADYYHFACAEHQIVFADGLPVETFYQGPEAERALQNSAAPVPDALPFAPTCAPHHPARPFAPRHRIKAAITRHLKHGRAFLNQEHPKALLRAN